MNTLALIFGYVFLTLAGVLLAGLGIWIAVDFYGRSLWKKLNAAYDLYVLQYHLQALRKRGRVDRESH